MVIMGWALCSVILYMGSLMPRNNPELGITTPILLFEETDSNSL